MIPSNSKQQQLTFDQGVTNVPSDAVCSDNTLEESLGLVYKNGEHQVIQDPVLYMKGLHSPTPDQDTLEYMSYKLLYVHKQNNQERYIVQTDNGEIVWGTREDGVRYAVPDEAEGSSGYPFVWGEPQDGAFLCYDEYDEQAVVYDRETGKILDIYENILMTVSGTPKVTSLGKTLVIADDTGIHTFIWRESGYSLQIDIPEPKVTFWLDGISIPNTTYGLKRNIQTQTVATDVFNSSNETGIKKSKQNYWNDLIFGLYAKAKKDIAQRKAFCLPFFARVALELFDETYAYMSSPVLLFPTVKQNTVCIGPTILITLESVNLQIDTIFSYLQCSQLTDYSDYQDIVKDVVIFISEGIEVYNIVDNACFKKRNDNVEVLDTIIQESGVQGLYVTRNAQTVKGGASSDDDVYRLFDLRDTVELEGEITSVPAFYKLCSIGTKPANSIQLQDKIGMHTLENLTTQKQLTHDNYYAWNKIVPEFMQSYNSRLLLANVKRDFFAGYSDFLTYCYGTIGRLYYTFRTKVTIRTDEKDVIVWKEFTTDRKQGIFFFYPDTRATHVVIYRRINNGPNYYKILNTDLKEHPSWNGAYYFYGMDFGSWSEGTEVVTLDDKCPTNNDYEQLGNYVIQSEVSNPWVFPPSGYHKVSVGKITGVSSNVQALSQGQFGQHPLLVFTDRGIWAMTVSNTGLFESIHPMSREVCINPASITQTDNPVFFVGEKGLMATTEANVAAVSQQLMGKIAGLPSFATFCRACLTAFDSRDALLWLFGSGNTCYVYSIASGAYATKTLEEVVTNTVNNYPDFLLQTDDKVYSLLARPDINEDENTYAARLITRPMKLENALAMKSIMQVRHIADMEGTMTLRVFASNNLTSWAELHSLRGMPWKYYRFRYDFTGLKATDRFAGTVVVTQDRRANKMR